MTHNHFDSSVVRDALAINRHVPDSRAHWDSFHCGWPYRDVCKVLLKIPFRVTTYGLTDLLKSIPLLEDMTDKIIKLKRQMLFFFALKTKTTYAQGHRSIVLVHKCFEFLLKRNGFFETLFLSVKIEQFHLVICCCLILSILFFQFHFITKNYWKIYSTNSTFRSHSDTKKM